MDVNRNTEDKQAICDALCATLKLTCAGADIERLEYRRRPGEEFVIIHRAGNNRDCVNVAWDSGAALIRDVMKEVR